MKTLIAQRMDCDEVAGGPLFKGYKLLKGRLAGESRKAA